MQLIERYIQWARQWSGLFDINQLIVNAGGGIGVNYSDLSNQFDWVKFTGGLKLLESKYGAAEESGLRIDFECGRYMTAFCGVYISQVLDIKHNYGKAFAILRGGTQHFRLPVSWKHDHPFRVIPSDHWPFSFERPGIGQSTVTLVGQLCTPKDVFAADAAVDQLRCGDLVMFVLAGAYGWAISHHDFLSHPHPEMVYC